MKFGGGPVSKNKVAILKNISVPLNLQISRTEYTKQIPSQSHELLNVLKPVSEMYLPTVKIHLLQWK